MIPIILHFAYSKNFAVFDPTFPNPCIIIVLF